MESSEKNCHLTGKAQPDQLPWGIARLRQAPFYTALQPALAGVAWPAHWPSLAQYQQVLDALPAPLRTQGGKRLRVVAQAPQKAADWRQGYEPRILLRGELQTRLENWHDFFNLLTWITFPRAKAALNARQYALLEARAVQAQLGVPRNAAQDALTQFDESGVIVLCADARLAQQLRDFQWKALFWENRERTLQCLRCWVFGHGLMERCLQPYRGLTGKAVILPVSAAFLAQPLAQQIAGVDRQLADELQEARNFVSPRAWSPLPLLGMPGFTAENATADYYDDPRYFRPGRVAPTA